MKLVASGKQEMAGEGEKAGFLVTSLCSYLTLVTTHRYTLMKKSHDSSWVEP